MKNLNFKYIAAKNFLCFGPDGIEINFEDYGNIVLIRGNNLDVKDEDGKTSSNGVGKSSILEILSYGLFGKTIKYPKKVSHKDVINNKTCKKLEIEVRWNGFRVVRSRKPDGLKFWENEDELWSDETEITLSGIPATQKLIENKLGLNYEAFINTVVFTDNNAGSFLECDTPTKRQIVENLLSLSKYREYSDVANKVYKSGKDSIKFLNNEYSILLEDLRSSEERIRQIREKEDEWKDNISEYIFGLEVKISKNEEELNKTDLGTKIVEYQEVQDKITILKETIIKYENNKSKVEEALEFAQEKLEKKREEKHNLQLVLQEQKLHLQECENNLSKNETIINEFKELKDGSKCPACYGSVKEENYKNVLQYAKNIFESSADNKKSFIEKIKFNLDNLDEINKNIKNVEEAIESAKKRIRGIDSKLKDMITHVINLSKIKEPQAETEQILIQERINEIKNQIIEKKKEASGPSPYEEIIAAAEADQNIKLETSKNKKIEVEEIEKNLPYYEFWVKAFGDNGIRKFVIDGIVPALNSRISYWLQFLIDNKLKLEFNNQFDEIIERFPFDGESSPYHLMSGGEKRRINLAVSQAFSYIMMLNCGTTPSLVFLDEVSTNVDPIGVAGVYNMICELSLDRKVFVTSHDHDLLQMLQGCESIDLKKENGFTKKV
jgi:DNA repair exonuclease SbcCD ATPase subunit